MMHSVTGKSVTARPRAQWQGQVRNWTRSSSESGRKLARADSSGTSLQGLHREHAKVVDAFSWPGEDCGPGRRAEKGMVMCCVVPEADMIFIVRAEINADPEVYCITGNWLP